MLFEVAVIALPAAGVAEQLVFGPKYIVARDSTSAGFKAVTDKDMPAGLDFDLHQVLVQPFCDPSGKTPVAAR